MAAAASRWVGVVASCVVVVMVVSLWIGEWGEATFGSPLRYWGPKAAPTLPWPATHVAPPTHPPQALALRSPGTQGTLSSLDDDPVPLLDADDFGNTRARALEAVEVPPSVLQLIADLRTYLQVRGGAGRRAGGVAGHLRTAWSVSVQAGIGPTLPPPLASPSSASCRIIACVRLCLQPQA